MQAVQVATRVAGTAQIAHREAAGRQPPAPAVMTPVSCRPPCTGSPCWPRVASERHTRFRPGNRTWRATANEFAFRFNRPRPASRGLVFLGPRAQRLALPVRDRNIVAGQRPRKIPPAPPAARGHPPSLGGREWAPVERSSHEAAAAIATYPADGRGSGLTSAHPMTRASWLPCYLFFGFPISSEYASALYLP